MDKDTIKDMNLGAVVEQSLNGLQSVAGVGSEYKDYFCCYSAEELISTYFKLGRLVSEAKWEKRYEEKRNEELKAYASVGSKIDYDDIPEPSKVTNSYEIKSGVLSLEFSSCSLAAEDMKSYKNYIAQFLANRKTDAKDSESLKKAIASFEENKSFVLSDIKEIPEGVSLPDAFKTNVLEKALANKTITEKGKDQLNSIKPFVSFNSEEGSKIYMNSIKEGSKVFLKGDNGDNIEVSNASFNILGGQLELSVKDGKIEKVNPKVFLQNIRQSNEA